MKKIQELTNKATQLKSEVQNLLDEGKVQDAKAKMDELREINAAIEVQKELDQTNNSTEQTIVPLNDEPIVKGSKEESATFIRALIKAGTGKKLSEVENALLVPTEGEGSNGEGYILPQEISTKIRELIREMKSLREDLDHVPTKALTGSFPIEDFETVSELIDFEDGTDGEEADDIRFRNVKFTLKQKGALIKLSNTLLEMTDNDLINYVARVFARKAIVTENKMAIVALKANKKVVAIDGLDGIRQAINVKLDPAVLYGTRIITNQEGFEFMDSQKDANGRAMLEVDPKNPTGKMYKGYPIKVYSSAILPCREDSGKSKAPIIIGNTPMAAAFIDKNQYQIAFSSEAGFKQNATFGRIIEHVDVVQVESTDRVYVYGEIEIGPSTLAVKSSKSK